MVLRTDTFDLGALRLASGQGRRIELAVAVEPIELGGQRYAVAPPLIPVRVSISRMTGGGYALMLELQAQLEGPCMRCLEPAAPPISVQSREVFDPADIDALDSPYLDHGVLDVGGWARDALLLAAPSQLVCHSGCAGLCPVCGADLNRAGPEHRHDQEPDSRWAKLSEIHFE